ncbi:class IV aminotransferase [Psychromonas sp. CNPT3]|uniref:aminodeoxychorismate lyase n=1 Tax=Psychromonas sp. CNPT3 TaxID=314282 RepID=UPI00006E80D6|nr:aminodeoxychorismate lyase [Psychromonas sp. CNPT3]AGH80761.1 class IV aminotransferase [Psychromonas sp. CNPT3]
MLINGIEENQISALDRGLAYADGLFSTIKVQYGQLCLWDLHLQRLQLGAQKLFFPKVDWIALTAEVDSVARSLKSSAHAVIKVILTRGNTVRGYSTLPCTDVLRIVSSSAFPEHYLQWQKRGIALIQCQTRLGRQQQLAGLKTLNRLEQVLIKHELESKHALEGLVCDEFEHVIEACSANVFLYLDNNWVTPRLDYCGVAGVQRRHIMQAALANGMIIVEQEVSIKDVYRAQALCLSNALMGIVPVTQYNEHSYNAKHFKLSAQLQVLIDY